MGVVRPAAVAGAFYPGSAARLRTEVDGLLAAADPVSLDIEPALFIVPHAGYRYSGSVAATAYRLIRRMNPPPRRVILLGPSHFVRFDGIAAPVADALRTPLGLVPIEPELPDGVIQEAAPHAREHSLEVQLPFLQRLLEDFTVLPLVTGEVPGKDAAIVLDESLRRPGTLAVVSSDLSHYLDYPTARRRDVATARSIVDLDAGRLQLDDACGSTAVAAALIVAGIRGWQCRLLELRNSGDTAGDRRRVVGYGAFAIGPAAVSP